jgi:hypothetical protein
VLLGFASVVTGDFALVELATMFAKVERRLAAADADSAVPLLAQSAVDLVPGAQLAGVTIGRGGRFTTSGATDEAVRTVDQLQYEQGRGPCVDAIVQDTRFNAADLRTDPRWPRFGHAAYETTGIVSMLSFRLFFEDPHREVLAGLNMYSRVTAAFDEASEAVGLLLATHGALAVARSLALDQAQGLAAALQSNRDIGVAIGILMAQYKLTKQQSFDLLRVASQHGHRKLHDIALDVIDTGTLELPPR